MFQTFTLFYLTLLVYHQLWFWIKLPQLPREEAGSPSKSECEKLQRLYTQSGAAYGSLLNLVNTSNLTVSKVRRFLHSKYFNTKDTFALSKFKRMEAFAIFTFEIWCIDLEYVDKLAKNNNV